MRERGENALQGHVLAVLTTSLCQTLPRLSALSPWDPWDRGQRVGNMRVL